MGKTSLEGLYFSKIDMIPASVLALSPVEKDSSNQSPKTLSQKKLE